MKRSSLLSILLLFVLLQSSAQKKDTAGLLQAATALNTALVQKDEQSLQRLLSPDLTYGHSNGWIEHKKELIENLHNGTLTYTAITQTAAKAALEGNTGVIRSKGNFDVLMGGKNLHFQLSILQVWVWKKRKWVLMSRQSVKEEQIR